MPTTTTEPPVSEEQVFEETEVARPEDESGLSPDASEVLLDMPSHMARGFLYILILTLGVLLTYTWYGKMDVVVKGKGKLIPKGKAAIVSSFKKGVLSRLLVKVGDEVEKGQLLAELDLTQSIVEGGKKEEDLAKSKRELDGLKAAIEVLSDVLVDGEVHIDQAKLLDLPDKSYSSAALDLQSAKLAYDKARKMAVEIMPKKMQETKNEILNKERDLAQKQRELDDARKELERSKAEKVFKERELADARKNLERAKLEVDYKKTEGEAAKVALNRTREQMVLKKRQLELAERNLARAEKQVELKKKRLGAAHKEVKRAQTQYKISQEMYRLGLISRLRLLDEEKKLDDAAAKVEDLKVEIETGATKGVDEAAAKVGEIRIAMATELPQKVDDAATKVEKVAMELETDKQKSVDEAEAKVIEHQLKLETEAQKKIDEAATKVKQLEGELENKKIELENARLKLQTSETQAAMSTAEADKKFLAAKLKFGAVLRGLKEKLTGKQTQLKKARLDQQLQSFSEGLDQIRSPVKGRIVSLSLRTPGQVVKDGTTLMTINPLDQPIVAEVKIPNKNIGRVQPGLEVKLKLDAYPYQRYGIVRGKVLSVSPDSKPVKEGSDESYFEATISLDKDTVTRDGKEQKLFTGLSLTAEIVVERRRILDQFLDPLRKLKE